VKRRLFEERYVPQREIIISRKLADSLTHHGDIGRTRENNLVIDDMITKPRDVLKVN
jgi:hypothetical protein